MVEAARGKFDRRLCVVLDIREWLSVDAQNWCKCVEYVVCGGGSSWVGDCDTIDVVPVQLVQKRA